MTGLTYGGHNRRSMQLHICTCRLIRFVKWIGISGSKIPNMGSPPTPYWQIVKGSRDLLLEFWDPLHISGMVWARNFKFGRQIDHRGRDCNPGLEFSIPGFGIVEFPIPGSRDPVGIDVVKLRLLKLPRGLRYSGRFLNYKCVRSCYEFSADVL